MEPSTDFAPWGEQFGAAGAGVAGALYLLFQAAQSFPVKNRFKERLAQARPADKEQAAAFAMLSVRRTPWFWLALASAVCGTAVPFLERLAGPNWDKSF